MYGQTCTQQSQGYTTECCMSIITPGGKSCLMPLEAHLPTFLPCCSGPRAKRSSHGAVVKLWFDAFSAFRLTHRHGTRDTFSSSKPINQEGFSPAMIPDLDVLVGSYSFILSNLPNRRTYPHTLYVVKQIFKGGMHLLPQLSQWKCQCAWSEEKAWLQHTMY